MESCAHTRVRGSSSTGSPACGVFDPGARPWIDVTAADADAIAAAVESCPTSALRYRRTNGQPQESPEIPTSVQPRAHGPCSRGGTCRSWIPVGTLFGKQRGSRFAGAVIQETNLTATSVTGLQALKVRRLPGEDRHGIGPTPGTRSTPSSNEKGQPQGFFQAAHEVLVGLLGLRSIRSLSIAATPFRRQQR